MQTLLNGFEDNLKTWKNAPKRFRGKGWVQNFIEKNSTIRKLRFEKIIDISKILLS